jgi:hypothetical protein
MVMYKREDVRVKPESWRGRLAGLSGGEGG